MKPKHIPANCPTCDTPLVVADSLDGIPESECWLDEWECPRCKDGLYLDTAPEQMAALVKDRETVSIDEVDV